MTPQTITPDTPFSLTAAADFGFGPNTGRPMPRGAEMRLAFVTDDLRHHAGVHLLQQPSGSITATVESEAASDVVMGQVRRILSLDRPGAAWLEVGRHDPVIGLLQEVHAGLRPVLFHSPYEAAAWSVISARRHRTQAAALRTRLAAAHGATFRLAGEDVLAFPTPEPLLGLRGFPGLEPARVERLHAVAQAALRGELEAQVLRDMPPDAALGTLQQLPGIGPTYATLILLRATGATDILTYNEPRLPSYVAHFYGLEHPTATRADMEEISTAWRPFRTWAAVLIRVAGDRAALSWAPTPPRQASVGQSGSLTQRERRRGRREGAAARH
ncbi:MAG: DNA-3-methyladenine glycosylase 2 family protein [Candidatus Dormiibacterota bacterium]